MIKLYVVCRRLICLSPLIINIPPRHQTVIGVYPLSVRWHTQYWDTYYVVMINALLQRIA